MTASTKPRGTWARYRGGVRLPRLGIGLLAAAGLLGLGLSSMGAVSAHTQTLKATTSAAGGSYVAVTPFRVADTRPNSGQPYAGMTLGAQQTLNVQVTGMGNVPAGAAAAVLNVTAVDPTAAGFLTVFPEGTTMPTVSNLNFAAGDTVPNLVTVGLSSSGMVSIYNSAGSTNVVVDVDGYYTSAAASNGSGLYNPLSPTRVMGTLQSGQAVGPNSVAAVTVAGSSATDGVPANATAVVVNVTAAHATAPSFLTVYPAGNTTPLASNLNFGAQMPNQAIANRVTVGVGSGGQIDVYNHAGTVNVDVDVDGYYTGSGGTGSTFVAIQPVRLTDTRSNMNGTPIAASSSETFSLTNSSIPSTAAAVAANFTVIPGDMPGYLTVYPTADSTVPVASDVNWTANESPAVPNYTIADTAGTGSVDAFNSHGATINLVIDAFGYFGPSTAAPVMISATVTDTQISVTYNEDVSCGSSAYSHFTYYYTGSATGGSVTSCATDSTNANQLNLGGSFTLPASTGGSLKYAAPTTNSTTNSVYATNDTSSFAGTQTVTIPAATTAPAMVSWIVTPGATGNVQVTYNEDVSCGSSAYSDFTYYYTGVASGAAFTSCSASSNVITLVAATSGVTIPGSGPSITYTAPTTNSTTASVYATGSTSPVLYAATQTLTSSAMTAPSMSSATVTPGASGTGSIAVSYSEDISCPGTATDVQAEFEYSNGGNPAYPTTCSTSGAVLTLGTFMTTSTGTTGATLVLPGSSDTLTFTAPGSPTTTNSPYATSQYPQFPASQTLDLTSVSAPKMATAAVTAGQSIVITYTHDVNCPATGADGNFDYQYTVGAPAEPVTGCSRTGTDTLTLTGAFNAPQGSASLTYTEPSSPTTANAVYHYETTSVFAPTQTISGSSIS